MFQKLCGVCSFDCMTKETGDLKTWGVVGMLLGKIEGMLEEEG